MNNEKRILEYLQSISPKDATNADIRDRTHVQPHQQVFQITDRLAKQGRIHGRRLGKEWHFSIRQGTQDIEPVSARAPRAISLATTGRLSPSRFEQAAAEVMGKHFGVTLG